MADQSSTTYDMRELMDEVGDEVIEYDFTVPRKIDIDEPRGAYVEDE